MTTPQSRNTQVRQAYKQGYTDAVNALDEFESSSYGHAMMVLAYDDSRRAVLVKNSWSSSFGLNGYLWASYDWFKKTVFESFAVNA